MKNTFKKSRWTRVLAGLFAVVMVITSLGVMPVIATETEPAATVVVPKVDFNSYSTLTIEGVDTGDKKVNKLTGWSETEPVFSTQNDSNKSGDLVVNIADNGKNGAGDKYFDTQYVSYTENEEPKTNNGVALNYNKADGNSGLGSIALTDNQQLVVEVSVKKGKKFMIRDRKNQDAPNLLNLIEITSAGKIVVYDGLNAAIGNADLPDTVDGWVDVKAVYTAVANGTDTVRIYLEDELVEIDGGSSTGVNALASEYLANASSRLQIEGYSTFDNFAVTKYDGIKYNDELEPDPVTTAVIPTINFDDMTVGTYTAPTAASTTKFEITGEAAGEIFSGKSNYTATIAAKTEGGTDKYVNFAGAEGAWYEPGNNANINKSSGGYAGVSSDGQVVLQAKVHSGTYTVWKGNMFFTNKYNGHSTHAERIWANVLTVSNGVLSVGSGACTANENAYYNADGTNPNYGMLGKVTLPQNQWVDIKLVYNIGNGTTTHDTVTTYVNDKAVILSGCETAEAQLLSDGVMGGAINRFEFVGSFDDVSMTTYEYGAKYDTSALEGASWNLTVMPVQNFSALEAGQYTTTSETPNLSYGDTNTNTGWTNSGSGRTTEVLTGSGAGKANTDKYLKSGGNDQYTTGNQSLSRHAGLAEGEQLVFDFQAISDSNLVVYTRFDGKRYVNDEGTQINNFNRLFDVSGNKLKIYNGEESNSSNDNDGDGIKSAVLKEIGLPTSRWSNITLVYTAGDAIITTAGASDKAEVITATKNDTVSVYVNGQLAAKDLELVENNLFRKISRFDIQRGSFDNFSVTKYTGGMNYSPDSTFSDTTYLNSIGFSSGKIMWDGTMAELKTAIEAKDGVTCTMIDEAGVVLTEDLTTADTALMTVGGTEYAIQITTSADYEALSYLHTSSEGVQITYNDRGTGYAEAGAQGESWSISVDGATVDPALTADDDVNAIYGKAEDDAAIKIKAAEIEDVIFEGDHPATKNVVDGVNKKIEGSYTLTQRTKRFWYINGTQYGTSMANALPIYMSFDYVAAPGELIGISINGGMFYETVARTGGAKIVSLSETEEGHCLYYNITGESATASASNGIIAEHSQWHNVGVQFVPGQREYTIYLDGVAHQGLLVDKYAGINNAYLDISGSAYIDNISLMVGFGHPSVPAEVDMTLPETEDLPEGYSWAEDGVTLNINKAALKEEVAEAYTTEDGEVVYLDAEGNVTDDMAMVNQIAVRATADGSIHYWPIKARTGMGRFDLGDNRWMIDVADGKGNMNEDVKVYVAKYNEKNVLADIDKYDVDAVDGDTWFVNATEGIEKGDKVFIWTKDGKIVPVYKDTTDINVVCWGDSLTEGVAGNGVDYTQELAKLIDYNVINMGVAGESLITIGARSGAYNIVLGEALDLPANRQSVDIKLSSTELYDENDYAGRIAPCNTNRGGWTPATIVLENGTEIEGKLATTYDTDANSVRVLTSATFMRDEAGEAVEIPAGAKIKIAAHDVEGDINIYWAGTNMGWDDTDLGSAKCTPENGIVALKKMILENEGIEFTSKQDVLDAEIPADAKFIVIGMTTGAANAWPGVNDAYAEAFGDNFLNVKEYLASAQALEDAGIEATEKDLEYIAAGKIPFSLLAGYRYPNEPTKADEVHFNGIGYKLIAKQVYFKMMSLGY